MQENRLIAAHVAASMAAVLVGAVVGCSSIQSGSAAGTGGTIAAGGARATGGGAGSTAKAAGGAAGTGMDARGGGGGSAVQASGGGAGTGARSTGGAGGQGASPPPGGGSGGASDPYPLPTAPAVNLSGAGKWSDPATWGGHPPAPGTDVVIPANHVVLIDTAVNVGQLEVDGTLACDPSKDASLTTKGIMVMGGVFACGSQGAPYTHQFTVTFTSAPSGAVTDPEPVNGIDVMAGGLLELFGEPRRGWTQLAKTAKAGDTTVTLLDPLGFRAGDHVVVASTDFDPGQAEEVVVASVSGSTLTLATPLTYMHWGELQMYPNSVAGAPSVLDERAEVGLLTRNILIQGDPSTEASGFGGHVMIMGGSKMYVQGVELYRVGQRSRLARYPLHWHLLGDATGQFIADTSIHHSFNRCVTIHGTQNATVLRNVCYDHIGHGYFLEDGVETGNLLAFNLGVATHTAQPNQEVLLSDRADLGISMVGKAAGPATFWVSNGDNTVVGNHAAGSDGSAFWYPPKPHPTGPSASNPAYANVVPYKAPIRQFSGNVSHSSQTSLILGFDQEQDGNENDWYFGPDHGTAIVDTYTAYKILGAIGGQAGNLWLRGGAPAQFHNIVTADSRHHYNFAYDATLDGGLLVGQSANVGNPSSDGDKKAGRSTPWHEEVGFGLYDGPHHVLHAYFTGFKPNPYGPDPAGLDTTSAIVQVDGAHSDPAHTFASCGVAPGSIEFSFGNDPGDNVSILDVDGSLTGHAGWYVTGRNPTMWDASCTQLQTSPNPVYACPGPELSVLLDLGSSIPNASSPGDETVTRSDGAKVVVGGFCKGCGGVSNYESNLLVGYDYSYSFPNPDRLPSVLHLRLENASAKKGQSVKVALPLSWGNIYVDRGGTRVNASANSAALDAGGSGYAPSAGGYTFKLAFEKDGADETLRICKNASCN